MEYKLAKELKDAGFSQSPFRRTCIHAAQADPMEMWVCDCKSEDKVHLPTLEELIEACGRITLITGKPSSAYKHGVPRSKQYGKTPTEAVARLWLALHFRHTH